MMKTMVTTKPWLGLLLAAALLALTGCMAEEVPEPVASCTKCWTYVQPNVFEGTCTGCHFGTGASTLGLSWQFGEYANIVTSGKISQTAANSSLNIKIVDNTGGTAALTASYVMHKIDSITYPLTTGDSKPMPPPTGGLAASKIQLVADWIVGGALYDTDPVP